MATRFFKIGSVGISFGAMSKAFEFSGGGLPTDGLTHTMTIQYVDASGVLQTVVATPSSATVISVPLGSPIFFDSTASTSVDAISDSEGESWVTTTHRYDTGEGLSGTWSLTGANKNVIIGAGILGHVYTTPGSFTFRDWFRDASLRQSLLNVTINVSDLAAGTDIAVGGSWPTFVSNTVYNLAAGTDHTSKGSLNLNGLHNVVIRKTGSGADPIVSQVNWHTANISSSVEARTRGCRLIGIDSRVSESSVGSLYCSIVNGRCRQYDTSADEYFWDNEAVGQTQKDNIYRTRGLALWNCGEINSNSSNYVLIFAAKNVVARNVDFHKTTGDAGQHVFRGWFDTLDLRLNRFRSSVPLMSFNKITGADNGTTFDVWPSTDRIGVWNGVKYLPVCRKITINGNIYGASGSVTPTGQDIEICPENDDAPSPDQAIEMASLESNVWYTASTSGVDAWFSGRYIQYFNNKVNLGAGGEISYNTNARVNRTPPSFQGPYTNADRPVVVP